MSIGFRFRVWWYYFNWGVEVMGFLTLMEDLVIIDLVFVNYWSCIYFFIMGVVFSVSFRLPLWYHLCIYGVIWVFFFNFFVLFFLSLIVFLILMDCYIVFFFVFCLSSVWYVIFSLNFGIWISSHVSFCLDVVLLRWINPLGRFVYPFYSFLWIN